MTKSQHARLQEAEDLARHASTEAAKRIMMIASACDGNRMKLMIGVKASKMLLDAFVMTAIEDTDMPREIAELTALKVMEGLMGRIDKHFSKAKEEV